MIESIMSWGNTHTFEYYGIVYLIKEGRLKTAPGQHAAAYKDKHRKNAQEMYNAEKI